MLRILRADGDALGHHTEPTGLPPYYLNDTVLLGWLKFPLESPGSHGGEEFHQSYACWDQHLIFADEEIAL